MYRTDRLFTANDRSLLKLGVSFFLFGLINNGMSFDFFKSFVPQYPTVLYVIILSAALDLVPPSTPKGIIAFCNITPALFVKVGWPYLFRGRVHYARRIMGCCMSGFIGMLVS